MSRGPQVPGCEEVARGLWSYLDGELSSRDAAAFEEHLKSCRDCREHADFEEQLLASIATLGRSHPRPQALMARVRDALRKAELEGGVT